MKFKFLIPLLLLSSCAPASLSSSIEVNDYKEYRSITYNDVTYYKTSQTIKVAKYRSHVPEVTQVKTYIDEYENQYIYAYLDITKDKYLSFERTAPFTYTCQKSHNDFTQDVTLKEEAGTFESYTKVYYSSNEKTIKVVEVVNKSSQDSFIYSELKDKTLYPAHYTDDILKIMTDEHAEGLVFSHSEKTYTIKVDDEKYIDLSVD